MKKVTGVTALLMAVIIIGAISSCTKTKDACQGVVCQNSGTCTNGSCLCATGYEGAHCETKNNAKFVGTYTGTANSGGSVTSETIPVEAQNDPLAIKIFLNSVHILTATISGNSISIPVQNFPAGAENYRYSGSGTLNGNALSLTIAVLYTSTSGDSPYTSVFTLSK